MSALQPNYTAPNYINDTVEVFRTCPEYIDQKGGQDITVIGRNFFDTDLSGQVELDELHAALMDLKLGGTYASVVEALNLNVEGGSVKTLTLDLFRSTYQGSFRSAASLFRDDVHAAFSYFDADKSGSLGYDEFSVAFRGACPFPVDDAAFDRIWKSLDVDSDGQVTMDEFVEVMLSQQLAHAEVGLETATTDEE